MCAPSSASSAIPSMSTMRGRSPPNSVPATLRAPFVPCTMTRIRVWKSLGSVLRVSATAIPRALHTTGTLTMLTASSCGARSAASAIAVSGLMLSSAAWPSYSMAMLLSPLSVSWPAKEPSCSASLMYGLSRAEDEVICHLLGDLHRDVLLRLDGRGAQMRRRNDVRGPTKRLLPNRAKAHDRAALAP